jgi:glycosyltransferase involved in cell wall biosynthesis
VKTIVIDCRFAATNSGLGRYTREIVSALLARSPVLHYVLLVRNKDEAWIPVRSGCTLIKADIDHYTLAEQMLLPDILRLSGADLFFSPHFNVPLRCPLPFVVTIHDLILHRFPNDASLLKVAAYKVLMKHAVMRSRSVICVSNFVKDELVSMYGSDCKEKTVVIGEGVDAVYRQTSSAEQERVCSLYSIHRPFFLYVGNAKQHKNLPMLIEAFHASERTDAELVLVSGGKEASGITSHPNVKIIYGVADDDLASLYSAAEAFVTASLYEGFCLPVAEALACGCPVIAPNSTAIPEVASGRALLVEPTVDAFATALQHVQVRREPFRIAHWADAAAGIEKILLGNK